MNETNKVSEKVKFGEKIKQHFIRNKGKYITGGVCLTVGSIATYFLTRSTVSNIGSITAQGIAVNSPVTNNITNEYNNYLSRRGHAGNVIRCLETGETFASQNRAAEVFNIPSSDLSKHLKGLKDDVKGLHFEKVGDFNSQ